ncbi:hypothetical protein ACO0LO_24375 [Undibacterium sp. TJN25]|uniref:hypothetical protein n=1 Tax=Undibacterium sp. TJN25 TaxID=3413056 RepID=UPI003BF33BF3
MNNPCKRSANPDRQSGLMSSVCRDPEQALSAGQFWAAFQSADEAQCLAATAGGL